MGQFQKFNVPWNKGKSMATNDTLRRLWVERHFKLCPYYWSDSLLCLFCYAYAETEWVKEAMCRVLRHFIEV